MGERVRRRRGEERIQRNALARRARIDLEPLVLESFGRCKAFVWIVGKEMAEKV